MDDYHRIRFKHLKPPKRAKRNRPGRFWIRLRRSAGKNAEYEARERELEPGSPSLTIYLPILGGAIGFGLGAWFAIRLLALSSDYLGAGNSAYDTYALVGAVALLGSVLAYAGQALGDKIANSWRSGS